jgi:hypothetical protein
MAKIVEAVRPTAAQRIAAEERALSDIERKITNLSDARSAKLIESDGVDDVATLDREIAAQHQTAGILRDRIEALHGEVRRQGQLAADRERADRIAVTETALRDRDAIAVKLETSIADMGRLYFELIDQNLVISRLWGMSNNALRVGALGESIISREVSHSMFAAGRPRGGVSRLPAPATVGLGIVGDNGAPGLANRIAAASGALLDMIRAAAAQMPESDVA